MYRHKLSVNRLIYIKKLKKKKKKKKRKEKKVEGKQNKCTPHFKSPLCHTFFHIDDMFAS